MLLFTEKNLLNWNKAHALYRETCKLFWSSAVLVDTRRKLNVHKTFRRRPGRLLNVFCTFNLRLVSTGIVNKTWLSCKLVIFLKESFVENLSWFIVVKKQFPANFFRKLELYSHYKVSTFYSSWQELMEKCLCCQGDV